MIAERKMEDITSSEEVASHPEYWDTVSIKCISVRFQSYRMSEIKE